MDIADYKRANELKLQINIAEDSIDTLQQLLVENSGKSVLTLTDYVTGYHINIPQSRRESFLSMLLIEFKFNLALFQKEFEEI